MSACLRIDFKLMLCVCVSAVAIDEVQNDDETPSSTTATTTHIDIVVVKSEPAAAAAVKVENGTAVADAAEPTANTTTTDLLCRIASQLRHVYSEMLLNVVQQGAAAAKELDSVQAQVRSPQSLWSSNASL